MSAIVRASVCELSGDSAVRPMQADRYRGAAAGRPTCPVQFRRSRGTSHPATDRRVTDTTGPLEAPATARDGRRDVAGGVANDDLGGAEDPVVKQLRPVAD